MALKEKITKATFMALRTHEADEVRNAGNYTPTCMYPEGVRVRKGELGYSQACKVRMVDIGRA